MEVKILMKKLHSFILLLSLAFTLSGCQFFNPILSSNSSSSDITSSFSSGSTTIEKVKVLFDNGESIDSVYVEKGNKVEIPQNPTKKDYEFKGWYLNDQLYDFDNLINQEITLSAKWEYNALISSKKTKFDNALYLDGKKEIGPLTEGVLPSKKTIEKDPHILIVPLRLSKFYNPLKYSKYLKDIEIAFTGDEKETGWESVSSYYKKSSYGQLNFEFTMIDEWFYDSSITENSMQQMYTEYYYHNGEDDPNEYILSKVLDYYDDQLDYSLLDSDKDQFIDGIWIIYDVPVNFEDEKSMFWAYSSQTYEWYDASSETTIDNTKARDNVYPYYYAWAGIDFMYPTINTPKYNTNNIIIDAHTYIHETGHLLGLDDYYDYDENRGPSRGLYGADMMDDNIGDHCPISKLLLGWIEPIVVNGKGNIDIDLRPFTTSGDVILLSFEPIDSIYSNYYLIEYYTNDGLNSNDQPISNGRGIRITKVNAELNIKNGIVSSNGGAYSTSFKYDNSDESEVFVEMLGVSNQDLVKDDLLLVNENLNFDRFEINVKEINDIAKINVKIK